MFGVLFLLVILSSILQFPDAYFPFSDHILIQEKITLLPKRLIEVLQVDSITLQSLFYPFKVDFAKGFLVL